MLRNICYSIYKFSNIANTSRGFVSQPISKRILFQSKRQSLVANMSCKVVSYEDVAAATENDNICIIDVREPGELQKTGKIPNSINIPLAEVENALKHSDDEFKSRFGRSKPNTDTPLIFSCQAGRRASMASEAAAKLGYKNAQVYAGSFSDWEKNSKK